MPTIVSNRKNSGLVQVAETAPPDWPRVDITAPLPNTNRIFLCEEKTLVNARILSFDGAKILADSDKLIFFDSVRQSPGYFGQFNCPVFTLDAPAEGAKWLWTPIAEKYFEKSEPKTNDIIFIGRTSYRAQDICALERMGVKIIPRDEKRSYQEYCNELKRARAVVNLCKDRVTGKPQLKGRVIETLMAGTVLLEEYNDLTPQKVLGCTQLIMWDGFAHLNEIIKELNTPKLFVSSVRGPSIVVGRASNFKFWEIVEGHNLS